MLRGCTERGKNFLRRITAVLQLRKVDYGFPTPIVPAWWRDCENRPRSAHDHKRAPTPNGANIFLRMFAQFAQPYNINHRHGVSLSSDNHGVNGQSSLIVRIEISRIGTLARSHLSRMFERQTSVARIECQRGCFAVFMLPTMRCASERRRSPARSRLRMRASAARRRYSERLSPVVLRTRSIAAIRRGVNITCVRVYRCAAVPCTMM